MRHGCVASQHRIRMKGALAACVLELRKARPSALLARSRAGALRGTCSKALCCGLECVGGSAATERRRGAPLPKHNSPRTSPLACGSARRPALSKLSPCVVRSVSACRNISNEALAELSTRVLTNAGLARCQRVCCAYMLAAIRPNYAPAARVRCARTARTVTSDFAKSSSAQVLQKPRSPCCLLCGLVVVCGSAPAIPWCPPPKPHVFLEAARRFCTASSSESDAFAPVGAEVGHWSTWATPSTSPVVPLTCMLLLRGARAWPPLVGHWRAHNWRRLTCSPTRSRRTVLARLAAASPVLPPVAELSRGAGSARPRRKAVRRARLLTTRT